ncbi:hypothetical protein AZI86_14350 [Bdellovibrio bacteriovorus]|uniref:Uncharacterized protein n=1 Tax=Bdellovibrio bacteriovorus TaxID=959 RepID=A0A150WJM2_BDEBC|nr:hypothetical protein [Bdellovibrio bacteriovorus]KYG63987.1 hypothetical protein AZI86_14350 [Bdellovibrio bacteriovorus]
MKHKISAFIGFTFSFVFIAMGFQNCAEQLPVLSGTLEVSSFDAASSEESMGTAPTDAKQTLESMMSLLNLAPADINMSEVNSEINYRRNLLVPQNDMTLLNAPSMIAITSLAAVVCKQAVAKDKRITTKEIFLDLDFSKGPKAYGKVGALKSYESLASRLWGRKATSEESAYFSEVVEEYFKTLDAAALDKATETDKLAIFICTGMLAVPDSYLL